MRLIQIVISKPWYLGQLLELHYCDKIVVFVARQVFKQFLKVGVDVEFIQIIFCLAYWQYSFKTSYFIVLGNFFKWHRHNP